METKTLDKRPQKTNIHVLSKHKRKVKDIPGNKALGFGHVRLLSGTFQKKLFIEL